jgi:hypothetical protein
MDPDIEARGWGDFHHKLISEIERILSDQVPEKYLVRLERMSILSCLTSESPSNQPQRENEKKLDLRRRNRGSTQERSLSRRSWPRNTEKPSSRSLKTIQSAGW